VRPPALALVLALIPALTACEDARPRTPYIRSIEPGVVAAGDEITIEGVGFGDPERLSRPGRVAVGGRPAAVIAWSSESVLARVPTGMPGGRTVVVLIRDGQSSEPAPLTVKGAPAAAPAARRFPPRRDAGRAPPIRDGGPAPPRDGGPPPPDGGRTDGPPAPVMRRAELFPDPAGGSAVSLAEAPRPAPSSLSLEVVLPPDIPAAWGIAFHLAYDRNVLAFQGFDPPGGDRFHAAEIAPGRLALGGVLGAGRQPVVATLRFTAVGVGETRIDFPVRYRTLRDVENRAMQGAGWAGGTVRVSEIAP